MGNLLGAPVTDKETHVGRTSDGASYGVSTMQGWRVHMEDAHICEPRLYALSSSSSSQAKGKRTKIDLPNHTLLAVFDGHGGTYAAAYAGRNMCRVLSKQPKFVEYAKWRQEREGKSHDSDMSRGNELLQGALRDAFVEIDTEIARALRSNSKVEDADQPYHDDDDETHASTMEGVTEDAPAPTLQQSLDEEGDSGTTAVVVLLTPESIVCANAGDSRAIYSSNGRMQPLSYDHKPDDEAEERRIRAAGGYVAGGRVEGDLAVSRGLGDFRFKKLETVMNGVNAGENGDMHMKPGDQKVSPIPDVTIQQRTDKDEFILIACDGIFDVQTNEEAFKSVADMFNEGETDIGLVCEELLDVCLQIGSKDNMTALVVKFDGQMNGTGGGVRARRQTRDDDRADKLYQQQSNA